MRKKKKRASNPWAKLPKNCDTPRLKHRRSIRKPMPAGLVDPDDLSVQSQLRLPNAPSKLAEQTKQWPLAWQSSYRVLSSFFKPAKDTKVES